MRGREKGLIIQLDGKIDDDYLDAIKTQTLKTDIPGKRKFQNSLYSTSWNGWASNETYFI